MVLAPLTKVAKSVENFSSDKCSACYTAYSVVLVSTRNRQSSKLYTLVYR